MEKVYFTDYCTFHDNEVKALGVILVDYTVIWKGKDYYISDAPIASMKPDEIRTSAPNIEDYRRAFEKHLGKELIYVSCASSLGGEYQNAVATGVPNLTVIDSGTFGLGQLEVLRRVMQERPWIGHVRSFFMLSNPNRLVKCPEHKYGIYEMVAGHFILIGTYNTRYVALMRLKKLVNSKLIFPRHAIEEYLLGPGFVGGVCI